MYQSVSFCDFCDAFRSMDRDSSFTYEGKRVLFEYIEEYENDTGDQFELDVIALCCDYAEGSIDELISEYSIDIPPECEDADGWGDLPRSMRKDYVRDYLADNTTVCGETETGFVYVRF